MNNPFFTVIIPCHNCSKTIERCLGSVVANSNSFDLDSVQIVMMNDGNDDDWISRLTPFYTRINIECHNTEKHKIHCPGNTRRDGMKYAKGDWIIFIDDDDIIADTMFYEFSYHIKEKGARNALIANVSEFIPAEHKFIECTKTTTLLHGKCYNRSFLEENHINFEENMESHEDLFFNTGVVTALVKQGQNYFYEIDELLYYWTYNENSITRSTFKDPSNKNYLEAHLADYLHAYTHYYIKGYKEGISDPTNQIFISLMCSIWYGFMYLQGEISKLGAEQSDSEKQILIKHINTIINECDISKSKILEFMYSHEAANLLWQIREEVPFTEGWFIETQSFKDFINENIYS